jgi:hypothetical protein
MSTIITLIVVAAILAMAVIVLACSALGIGQHPEPGRHARPGPRDTGDLADPADTTDPDGTQFVEDIKADAAQAAVNTSRPDQATLARVRAQLLAEQPPAGTPVNLGYPPRAQPPLPAWVTTTGQPPRTETDTTEPEPATDPPPLIPPPAPQPTPPGPTFTPAPDTAPATEDDDPDITRAQLHAVRTWGGTPAQIAAELAEKHLTVKS